LPIPLHEYYKKLGFNINDLPNTISFYNQVLSIPLFPKLSRSKQQKIIKVLNKIVKSDG